MRLLPVILIARSRAERRLFIRGGAFHTLAFTGGLVGSVYLTGSTSGSGLTLVLGLLASLGLFRLALLLEFHLDRLARALTRAA